MTMEPIGTGLDPEAAGLASIAAAIPATRVPPGFKA